MIKKIITISMWEYLEKVKTKAFIISLIVTPLLIIAVTLLPSLLLREDSPKVEVIGVLDTSGIYFNYLEEVFQKYELPDGQRNYVLVNLNKTNQTYEELIRTADKNVIDNFISGYLIIELTKKDSLFAEYRSNLFGNFKVVGRFEEALNYFNTRNLLQKAGIQSTLLEKIQQRTIIKQKKISEDGKVSDLDFLTTFFLSVIFILLLMMMVVYSGQMLVRSMIEEKSSRLIEMLVSSSTPDELLTGKILGLSMLGITQILIWVLIGISLIASSLLPLTAFNNIIPMLLYFILGFLFYASLFVGIGSTVNTEQEAQQITTYLSLILMLPVVIAMPAIQNPDFIVTKVFSYIPLTIPTVMLLRLNVQNVTEFEILISLIIMVISIFIVTKVSAKLFRIGILSYGNKPTIKEIFQWIKE
ncbi:MAG: ABC transporter permease [Ignavibacteriaceae bacterium]|nr:ABC transporter permease [Ignavibacteriaceae bacterium]